MEYLVFAERVDSGIGPMLTAITIDPRYPSTDLPNLFDTFARDPADGL